MASDAPLVLRPAETLTAQCYCKSVHFTVTVPTSALPLPVHLCHCHICRHTHGTLCTFHAPLPAGISPVFIAPSFLETSLTGYTHSDQAASTRFFCKTCGCHIGDRDREAPADGTAPAWRVATSIFDTHAASVFDIRTHVFTPRDGDGSGSGSGLHWWLPSINGRAVRTWNPEPGDPTFPIPAPAPPAREVDAQGRERLRAECHCGGVSFSLPRPDDVHADIAAMSTDNREKGLSAWNAVVDVSDASRLVSGAHAVAWASVPRAALDPAVPADLRFGSLVPYESPYEGSRRAFCGVCGAIVFYYSGGGDGGGGDGGGGGGGGGDVDTVRVAVGILRAPDGVLALDWLMFRTANVETGLAGGGGQRVRAFDGVFTEALTQGLRDWGWETHGLYSNFETP
ncbi:Mss4-like protein [Lasiosphaeria miniovina]|uniref:Mss4-like protein n=1 Tax=Lasiosphaeria miniovina TaxID=1954250 RepID=A0AA40DYQ1_9PEZI|nr:Mss4-like protein [Lasiosphaeria miniovina]KAK0718582.1 Mss4-like protein [Lasiosphaeria miniovina]